MRFQPFALFVLLCLLAFAGPLPANHPADVVLHHGKVFTVDPDHPWATAVAIRGSRILAVGSDAAVLALMADGEGWSTSALAMALGASQRTLQRALSELEASDKVRAVGRGRTRRWLAAPIGGFATTLLLPALPGVS